MNKQLNVTKRDGNRVPLDLEIIHRRFTWAAEDLSNFSLKNVQLYDYDHYLKENHTIPKLSKYLIFQALINKQLAFFYHEEQELIDAINGNCNFNFNLINHNSDLIIRTRNRILKYVFDLRELLRVSSKFARAPPITPFKSRLLHIIH